jgi:hypothetical protein
MPGELYRAKPRPATADYVLASARSCHVSAKQPSRAPTAQRARRKRSGYRFEAAVENGTITLMSRRDKRLDGAVCHLLRASPSARGD